MNNHTLIFRDGRFTLAKSNGETVDLPGVGRLEPHGSWRQPVRWEIEAIPGQEAACVRSAKLLCDAVLPGYRLRMTLSLEDDSDDRRWDRL